MSHGALRSQQVLVLAWTVALAAVAPGCDWYERRQQVSKGNELYNAQRYKEAIEQYEAALATDPDSWPANYGVAIANVALYQNAPTPELKETHGAAARAALERCTKLQAPTPEAAQRVQDFYAGMLVATGDSTTALQMAEEQLARDPENPQLVLRLAGLYAKAGNFAKSLEYHERRAELEPGNAEAWYNIGVLCWDRSSHGGILVSQTEREAVIAKGLQALERADALVPDSFDTLVYMNLLYRERAKAHTTLGRAQEAAADLALADQFRNRAQALKKAPG
jgi:tetratricopeptide (TPR) repeat protein